MRRATMKQVAPLVNPDALDAELTWRWQWLETQQYDPPTDAPDQRFSDQSPPPTTTDSGGAALDPEDDPAGAWKEESGDAT
jgi:hypothetical protein